MSSNNSWGPSSVDTLIELCWPNADPLWLLCGSKLVPGSPHRLFCEQLDLWFCNTVIAMTYLHKMDASLISQSCQAHMGSAGFMWVLKGLKCLGWLGRPYVVWCLTLSIWQMGLILDRVLFVMGLFSYVPVYAGLCGSFQVFFVHHSNCGFHLILTGLIFLYLILGVDRGS